LGPDDGTPSSFVSACLSRSGVAPPGRVLDIPCGFGRHASFFAERGFWVVGFDIDARRASFTSRAPAGPGSICAVNGNAESGLPFTPESFDLALVIHYVSPRILRDVEAVLRPGGFLIYETFGAQGRNWVDLPKPGDTRAALGSRFDIIMYRERPAGPERQAASVKLLAQKR
jgi:SAM-dependent methyltransferase